MSTDVYRDVEIEGSMGYKLDEIIIFGLFLFYSPTKLKQFYPGYRGLVSEETDLGIT